MENAQTEYQFLRSEQGCLSQLHAFFAETDQTVHGL